MSDSGTRDPRLDSLRELLSEPGDVADRRAGRWLEDHGGTTGRPWILHGAGNLGRKILEHIRETGQRVVAITDGREALWGSEIEDLRVQPPLKALDKWGSEAAVLVSICNTNHAFRDTRDRLRAASEAPILPVQGYFWRYPSVFLPYFGFDLPSTFLRAKESLLKAAGCFADAESLAQYVGQLRWRIRLEAEALPCASPETQYFPPDLVPKSLAGLFVDCGAYDGDTLRALIAHAEPPLPAMVAYEPDPANFARLLEWKQTLPQDLQTAMTCLAKAVGSENGRVSFSGEAGGASRIDAEGDSHVSVVRLEDDLEGQSIGFLKMDLEGFEQTALQGAGSLLGGRDQYATICIYHRPDDFWTLPTLMAERFHHHRLYLRTHGQDGFDVVCYAIPTHSPSRQPS